MDSGTPRVVHGTPRSLGRGGGIQQTPLVIQGTPRTPGTAFSASTPGTALPRGDIGRGSRVPNYAAAQRANYAATPSTPNGFDSDSMGGGAGGGRGGGGGGGGGGDGGGGGGGGGPGDNDYGREDNHEMRGMDADGQLIWGTNISVTTVYNTFRDFVQNFSLTNEFEPFYIVQLETLHRTQALIFNVNCAHLASNAATRSFYRQLVKYPQELIPIMDLVVNNEYVNIHGERDGSQRIQTRTFGLTGQPSKMRDLDPGDIDQVCPPSEDPLHIASHTLTQTNLSSPPHAPLRAHRCFASAAWCCACRPSSPT